MLDDSGWSPPVTPRRRQQLRVRALERCRDEPNSHSVHRRGAKERDRELLALRAVSRKEARLRGRPLSHRTQRVTRMPLRPVDLEPGDDESAAVLVNTQRRLRDEEEASGSESENEDVDVRELGVEVQVDEVVPKDRLFYRRQGPLWSDPLVHVPVRRMQFVKATVDDRSAMKQRRQQEREVDDDQSEDEEEKNRLAVLKRRQDAMKRLYERKLHRMALEEQAGQRESVQQQQGQHEQQQHSSDAIATVDEEATIRKYKKRYRVQAVPVEPWNDVENMPDYKRPWSVFPDKDAKAARAIQQELKSEFEQEQWELFDRQRRHRQIRQQFERQRHSNIVRDELTNTPSYRTLPPRTHVDENEDVYDDALYGYVASDDEDVDGDSVAEQRHSLEDMPMMILDYKNRDHNDNSNQQQPRRSRPATATYRRIVPSAQPKRHKSPQRSKQSHQQQQRSLPRRRATSAGPRRHRHAASSHSQSARRLPLSQRQRRLVNNLSQPRLRTSVPDPRLLETNRELLLDFRGLRVTGRSAGAQPQPSAQNYKQEKKSKLKNKKSSPWVPPHVRQRRREERRRMKQFKSQASMEVASELDRFERRVRRVRSTTKDRIYD